MNWNNPLIVLIAFVLILFAWRKLTARSFFPSKKRLIELLEKSERMVSKYEGGYSGEYLSAQDFHKDLKSSIEDYKDGDDSKLELFYFWFSPACQWDDFVGSEGEKIANEVFEIVSKLKDKAS